MMVEAEQEKGDKKECKWQAMVDIDRQLGG